MATSFCKENIHLIVIVLDCKNVQNRCDDSVKLTFWGYNRLNAVLEYFKKGNSGNKNTSIKTGDTTASSGQSRESQKNKANKGDKSGKLVKNRSRRFTAEKHNRNQKAGQTTNDVDSSSKFLIQLTHYV